MAMERVVTDGAATSYDAQHHNVLLCKDLDMPQSI